MSTRITTDPGFPNRCTIRTPHADGSVEQRHFFTAPDGGSVRENWDRARLVCHRLATTGPVLTWQKSERFLTLADRIRHEHRAALRTERTS